MSLYNEQWWNARYSGLGDGVPVTLQISKATFAPGEPMTLRATGAPNEGVLIEIKKGAEIIQALEWEGKRTDSAGVLEWEATAPTAPGSYTYRAVVSQVGLTYDPQASASITVAPVSSGQEEFPGDVLGLPSSVTVLGFTVSPLVLIGAAAVGLYLLSKGR